MGVNTHTHTAHSTHTIDISELAFLLTFAELCVLPFLIFSGAQYTLFRAPAKSHCGWRSLPCICPPPTAIKFGGEKQSISRRPGEWQPQEKISIEKGKEETSFCQENKIK
jgi:hypothetical protein